MSWRNKERCIILHFAGTVVTTVGADFNQGWANVLFKRTFCSHVLFRSFQKNVSFSVFISILCKRTFCSLRSFPFFAKECFVLTFFFFLFKRTFRALHSFPYFAKEHFVLCVLFFSLKRMLHFFGLG